MTSKITKISTQHADRNNTAALAILDLKGECPLKDFALIKCWRHQVTWANHSASFAYGLETETNDNTRILSAEEYWLNEMLF